MRSALPQDLDPAERRSAASATERVDASGAVRLARECEVFCAYLGGGRAGHYVIEKYARGHRSLPTAALHPDLLDRSLVAVASISPWLCGVADAYAARLRPYGVLRAKLVLLLAILENTGSLHARYDQAIAASRLVTLLGIVAAGATWGLRLAVALVVFTPVWLLTALRSGARG